MSPLFVVLWVSGVRPPCSLINTVASPAGLLLSSVRIVVRPHHLVVHPASGRCPDPRRVHAPLCRLRWLSRRQLALGSTMCVCCLSTPGLAPVPTRPLAAGPRQPLVPPGGTRAGSGRVARRWPADRGLLALPSGVGRRRSSRAHPQAAKSQNPVAMIESCQCFYLTTYFTQ